MPHFPQTALLDCFSRHRRGYPIRSYRHKQRHGHNILFLLLHHVYVSTPTGSANPSSTIYFVMQYCRPYHLRRVVFKWCCSLCSIIGESSWLWRHSLPLLSFPRPSSLSLKERGGRDSLLGRGWGGGAREGKGRRTHAIEGICCLQDFGSAESFVPGLRCILYFPFIHSEELSVQEVCCSRGGLEVGEIW